MLAIQKNLTNFFYTILSLPATAVGFCLSTQVATLSWILSTEYHLHIEDVTLVWLAGPLSGLTAQPIVGIISDNNWFLGGRRKPFIAIGGILGASMLLALPEIDFICKHTGASVFVVAVIIALSLDMSVNVTFNPARSIIADVTPTGEPRTKAFSWMQVVSGSFGIGAYFISVAFGNTALIYTAAALVFIFTIIPICFIEEPKILPTTHNTTAVTTGKKSIIHSFKLVFPLYGFILFSLFTVVNKMMFNGKYDFIQTKVMFICLGITLILGTITIKKGIKKANNTNDFQKIILAHSFSWLGIQSMFVMSFFYVKDKIVYMLGNKQAIANSFSQIFSHTTPSKEETAGNILSLGFLLLNAVGALLPVFVLEPLSKLYGKINTYITAISFMVIGFFILFLGGHTEWVFYLGMFTCGIGWSAVISIVFAIMTEKVAAQNMGMYMSLFNFSIVLPAMMTTGISKLIIELNNSSYLYLIITVCLIVSIICWLFVKDPSKK
ncbi:MAG: MFS transporter [Chitinophagaceae bacterium]